MSVDKEIFSLAPSMKHKYFLETFNARKCTYWCYFIWLQPAPSALSINSEYDAPCTAGLPLPCQFKLDGVARLVTVSTVSTMAILGIQPSFLVPKKFPSDSFFTRVTCLVKLKRFVAVHIWCQPKMGGSRPLLLPSQCFRPVW